VVNYSGGNCGCLTAAGQTATLAISKGFTTGVTSATACAGTPATLTAIPGFSGAVTYSWSTGDNTQNIVVTPTVSTVYTVTLSAAGCSAAASGSVTFTTLKPPILNYHYPGPLCTANEVVDPLFQPGYTQGGIFTANNGLAVDSATGRIPLKASAPGDYTVNYTVPAKGCTSKGTGTTGIIIYQSGNLSGTPYVSVKPGESIKLDVHGGINYSWTPGNNLSCTDCESPVASPAESTTYCVVAEVNSCYAILCVYVEVLCGNGGDLSVPNAFTPNNDGRNEKFCLQGWARCNTAFNVMIFDRWGEKVFESSDPAFCWDGNYNGEKLSSGVFAYVINATFNNEDHVTKKGNITIIR
jgi:gliding motility-associated-like protein